MKLFPVNHIHSGLFFKNILKHQRQRKDQAPSRQIFVWFERRETDLNNNLIKTPFLFLQAVFNRV